MNTYVLSDICVYIEYGLREIFVFSSDFFFARKGELLLNIIHITMNICLFVVKVLNKFNVIKRFQYFSI